MRKKTYYLAICLLLLFNTSFGQWTGSTTTADAYRDGNVGTLYIIDLNKKID